MKVRYFRIEWFSKTDGPGNRTVLLLQGCNLRCPWCHLPHSREERSPILFNRIRCLNCLNCIDACNNNVHFVVEGIHELDRNNCIMCGKCIEACPTSKVGNDSGALCLPTLDIDTSELLDLLRPQLEVLKNKGGLTISGGEALLQKEAVLEILMQCKAWGVHTAIETSLSLPLEHYKFVSEYVDCWLIGMRDSYLKSNNIKAHEGMIDNIRYLSHLDKEVIVRFPAIKGFTQSKAQLARLVELMNIGRFKDIEVLPCNKGMDHYYTLSGIKKEIDSKKALLDDAEVDIILAFFREQGLNARLTM